MGIHTEACMSRPETCCTAGGTIGLWIRVIDCPSSDAAGIITTIDISGKTGSRVYCKATGEIG